MRIIIYGAGAVGGAIGGRLVQAGHDVVLICRGAHLEALRANGMLLQTPEGEFRLPVTAVGHPSEIEFRPGDAVIMTMKTQHTTGALLDLEAAAGTDVPVICAQNGVENERMAARRFANVYAMLVALPATYLVPGEVIAAAAPLSGCLHAGVYPSGTDPVIEEVCRAIDASRYRSLATPDVMRLKYRKLIQNLGNAMDVVCGRSGRAGDTAFEAYMSAVNAEASACFAAAGIDAAPQAEYRERVNTHYALAEVAGQRRTGSSTLQSVQRGHREIEVDYLNGEIVMLGRLHGVPTRYNTALRREANRIAAQGLEPGCVTIEDLTRMAQEPGGKA